MRWHRNSRSRTVLGSACTAQAAHDGRADQVGDRQRQLLPGGDEQPVFRIERIVVGYRGARGQAVAVGQGGGRKTPVVLEGEGAGADLAAAEIEQAGAASGGSAQYVPIHEIVAGYPARGLRASAVV